MKTPVLFCVFSLAIACTSSLAAAEVAPGAAASSKSAEASVSSASKGKSKDVPGYFGGAFVSVEPPQTMERRIHRAIESVVGRMSIFTKGKARSNLRRLTKPCMSFGFDVNGENSVIRCEDRDENAAPLNGKRVRLRSKDGEDYQLAHVFDGDKTRVVQTFYSKHGSREDTYEFIDDGKRLVVHTRVSSKWLSRDVRYALYFERDASQGKEKATQTAKK